MSAAGAAGEARPGRGAVLWASVRPQSLVVGALPAVVGTAALVPERAVRPGTAIGCLAVAVLLQAGTNAVNDAEDALTGADDVKTSGASLPMRRGWIGPRDARRIGLACLAAAGAIGLAVALTAGRPWLLLLGAAGAVIGWAYTAPPLRLAYRPLGELASGLPMGLGITWGTAAAQTAAVPRSVFWAAGPLVLLTAAVLHANNARDRVHDAAVGKRTVATRLSPAGVVAEFRLLTGLVPVLLVAGLALRQLPITCAVALIPGALALQTAAQARTDLPPRAWTGMLIRCVRLDVRTGAALAVGLAAAALLPSGWR